MKKNIKATKISEVVWTWSSLRSPNSNEAKSSRARRKRLVTFLGWMIVQIVSRLGRMHRSCLWNKYENEARRRETDGEDLFNAGGDAQNDERAQEAGHGVPEETTETIYRSRQQRSK